MAGAIYTKMRKWAWRDPFSIAVTSLYVLAGAVLAWLAISGILSRAGEPAAPLDDTFIHLQFARSFAEAKPLVYSGEKAVAGATSLLWPALLSPFWAVGLKGSLLLWPAWCLGFLCLTLTAHETRKLSEELSGRGVGAAAGGMVIAFGGLVWCAASGMEILLFTWLLTRATRRSTEYFENQAPPSWELVVLAWLAPLARPEGILATLLVVLALAIRAPKSRWQLSGFAALGLLLTPGINKLATGSATTTTAQVKWLFHSPYLSADELLATITYNTRQLFSVLLNGELWSVVFIPEGSAPVTWLALPALLWAGFARNRLPRAMMALILALGMLIPTTYDSFLWNRLRYLWPFAPGWFVALGALSTALGYLAGLLSPKLRRLELGVAAGLLLALATKLPWTLRDLGESAAAIHRQHVELGRWAKDNLPKTARLGVNDTGAIAYYSERTTFDIVGLTTPDEARYWVAGAGSRFEHYEKLGPSRLPTHFIVYPNWFMLSPLLGKALTARSVYGATILGGTTKVAHQADYWSLGSGAEPTIASGKIEDALDVADLESEAVHTYRLLDATQRNNQVFTSTTSPTVDGGRGARRREIFELACGPKKRWVARFVARKAQTLQLQVDNVTAGHFALRGSGDFEEVIVVLPTRTRAASRCTFRVDTSAGADFAALHYWLLGD